MLGRTRKSSDRLRCLFMRLFNVLVERQSGVQYDAKLLDGPQRGYRCTTHRSWSYLNLFPARYHDCLGIVGCQIP